MVAEDTVINVKTCVLVNGGVPRLLQLCSQEVMQWHGHNTKPCGREEAQQRRRCGSTAAAKTAPAGVAERVGSALCGGAAQHGAARRARRGAHLEVVALHLLQAHDVGIIGQQLLRHGERRGGASCQRDRPGQQGVSLACRNLPPTHLHPAPAKSRRWACRLQQNMLAAGSELPRKPFKINLNCCPHAAPPHLEQVEAAVGPGQRPGRAVPKLVALQAGGRREEREV